MDILAAIEADFTSKKNSTVTVPEWGGVIIHFNALTAHERVQINKGVPAGDETALFINLLLQKARNVDGSPLFEDSAKTRALLEGKADFNVIARVVGEMKATPGDTPDTDKLKNA